MRYLVFLVAITTGAAVCQPRPGAYTRGEIVRDLFMPNSAGQMDPDRAAQDLFDQQDNPGKKSIGMAVIYSLLLPGMGELYAGDYGIGKYFTIAEGALVVTLISVDRYANWLQDDARQYAVLHAGVTVGGKDDRYFSAIGDFQNIYDYNEAVLRDRDPSSVYDPQSSYYWSWDNGSSREAYREVRVSSDERFNDTRFIAAAIAVNHLVSAINAARIAYRHNKQVEESGLIDVHAGVVGGLSHPSGIMLTLTKHF